MSFKYSIVTLFIVCLSVDILAASNYSFDEFPHFKRKVFMGPSHQDNPLKIFRLPISKRIKYLSIKLSQHAKTDLEKIICFMNYIGTFTVGIASSTNLDTIVDEAKGACGAFTNVFLALCAVQGIEGKVVGLYNYPESNGHVVSLAKVGGKFRLFDPTYAAYYAHANDSTKEPLGFEEIINGYSRDPASIEMISTVYREGIEQFTGMEIFLQAKPSGILGSGNPMSYPLCLDLSLSRVLNKTDFGPKNQGAKYIGVAAVNNFQSWLFKNLTANNRYEFWIYMDSLAGDITYNDDRKFIIHSRLERGTEVASLENSIDFSRGREHILKIPFIALEREVVLQLSHPYRGPGYRYINMSKYALLLVD